MSNDHSTFSISADLKLCKVCGYTVTAEGRRNRCRQGSLVLKGALPTVYTRCAEPFDSTVQDERREHNDCVCLCVRARVCACVSEVSIQHTFSNASI